MGAGEPIEWTLIRTGLKVRIGPEKCVMTKEARGNATQDLFEDNVGGSKRNGLAGGSTGG